MPGVLQRSRHYSWLGSLPSICAFQNSTRNPTCATRGSSTAMMSPNPPLYRLKLVTGFALSTL